MKFMLTLLAGLLVSVAASALDLDSARELGIVGERLDGYIGLIQADNSDAATLVKSINTQRRTHYQEIANKQNTPLANIEKIAGEKLTGKARDEGFYYQAGDSSWQREQ
ncbi:YdbL family protein [Oceanobacter mangrovi]|uniref:YdbL family protein n=1 Tax=Oceanobacter mangrovi TaxID=2862510 RepID=UPI001C8D79C6|nr:YdbL family protein [Oceanobacter mangrovi]